MLQFGRQNESRHDARRRWLRAPPRIPRTYLQAAAAPGCRYFMLWFSDQLGDWGLRRVSKAEIESSCADSWHIDSTEESRIGITIDRGAASGVARTVSSQSKTTSCSLDTAPAWQCSPSPSARH